MDGDEKRVFLAVLILLGIRVGIFAPFLIYAPKANMWKFAEEVGLILLLIAVPLLVHLSERRSK